ncbi:MAG: Cof-type HAD-IIB family hydrolase [Lachnospiraceae bacterium]|nr:Cof-type HAD-IIB family hydrolase [Lachnospiraceae bacterium]
MRKAVFFDIDGTIWDEKHQIPDSTREAFRKMKDQGHYLFISSGRTRVFIPDQELMPLGFDGILAGCGTYGEFQSEVKFYHQIALEEIQRVNRFLQSLDASYILEGRYFLYLDAERFPKESPFPQEMKGELGEKMLRVTGNEDSLEVSKFCVNYLAESEKQKELERVLEQGYTIIHRGGNFMEIVPKGFHKATGIQEICKILGINHADTYSFGDSTNDLDMLQYTAHSVAMGDGMQQAKDAAEYVTAPLWEDGIYQACRHYGLI